MLKAIVVGSEKSVHFFETLLSKSLLFEFVGFYNPSDPNNNGIFDNYLYGYELADKADVFILDAKSSVFHPALVEALLRKGKHILCDGFLFNQPDEIVNLQKLNEESGSCFQIANVLYHKPLSIAALQFLRKPGYVKIDKFVASVQTEATIDWLSDCISHEIDMLLRIIQSPVRQVVARPVNIFGNFVDLMNVHIEFVNDAVCHLTVGRALPQNQHTYRIFQKDRFFHLDFEKNTLGEYRTQDNNSQLSMMPAAANAHKDFIEIERTVMPFESWQMELRNFAENIEKKLTPQTTIQNMYDTFDVLNEMSNKLNRRYFEIRKHG